MNEIVRKIKVVNSVVHQDFNNLADHVKNVATLNKELTDLIDKYSRTIFLSQIDDLTFAQFKVVVRKSTDLARTALNVYVSDSFNLEDEETAQLFAAFGMDCSKYKPILGNKFGNLFDLANYSLKFNTVLEKIQHLKLMLDHDDLDYKYLNVLTDELTIVIDQSSLKELVIKIDKQTLNNLRTIANNCLF